MLDFTALIERMAEIFFYLVVGYVARKTGVTDETTNEKVSGIVIAIGVPCMILDSVMNAETSLVTRDAFLAIGLGFLVMGLAVLCGLPAGRLLRVKKESRGTYVFLATYANIGIMGQPIIRPLFGNEGVFIAALCNIPINLYVYTAGVYVMAGGRRGKLFSIKSLLNPPLLGSLAAAAVFLLKITFPDPVVSAVGSLGDLTLPLAMLVTGGSLAGLRLKDIFSEPRLYGAAGIRLLIIPLITWLVLGLFIRDSLWLGVFTVMAAMPSVSTTTALAIAYGGDETAASRGVFLSTILCIVTVPVIVYLLLL